MFKIFKSLPTSALLISSILMALVISSCSESTVTPECDLSFKVSNIIILTSGGEPADSVDISTTIERTNKTFDPCVDLFDTACANLDTDGAYPIFHDGFSDEISSEGDRVIGEGEKGNLSFSEVFIFEFDGCRAIKVEGPDTVILGP